MLKYKDKETGQWRPVPTDVSNEMLEKLEEKANKEDISRTSTIVIANYDSHENSKKGADIVIEEGENAAIQINKAIQSLEGIGGEVRLMEGEYNLEHGIAANVDGIHLIGTPDATILVANENWSVNPSLSYSRNIVDTWRFSSPGPGSVSISNLIAIGNESTDSSYSLRGDATVTNCVSNNAGKLGFDARDNSLVVNCTSNNSSDIGFDVYNNSKLIHCTDNGAQKKGFEIEGTSQVIHCTSNDSQGMGFFSTSSLSIDNCVSNNSAGVGFGFYYNARGSNCTSISSGAHGFECAGTSQVSNCTSRSSGLSGFYCRGSARVTGCYSVDSTGDGYECKDDIRITNCTSSNSGKRGIACVYGFTGVCANNILLKDTIFESIGEGAIVQNNIIWGEKEE